MLCPCQRSGQHWVILGATGFFAEWLSQPSRASPRIDLGVHFPHRSVGGGSCRLHTGVLQGLACLGADPQACKPTELFTRNRTGQGPSQACI